MQTVGRMKFGRGQCKAGQKATRSIHIPRVSSTRIVKIASAATAVQVTAREQIKSFEQYKELYEWSIRDPAGFWADFASQFHWEKKWAEDHFDYNFDVRKGPVFVNFFKGGVTNICYNALDRHVAEGHGATPCLLFEGNDPDRQKALTYAETLEEVCKLANWLKAKGVKKGDTVAIYMPMILELPIAMLACARIGAVHSVVFGGFSADSLAGRMEDAKSRVLLTCSGVMRATKSIKLKSIADKAVSLCAEQGFNVDTVLVYENDNAIAAADTPFTPGRDHWWQSEVASMPSTCPVEWVDSEHPLFLLYTSGSTGKPKGVLHTTGGYMIYSAATSKHVFGLQRGDVYWCTADCGWITGHSYLAYGPMLNGVTNIVFEGVPTHPTPARCWEVVEKYKVKQFYTAPTALRSLMRSGDEWVKACDRSSLKVLGSVGEPINPEAWRWYHEVVGDSRCPIMDTWWQTETGGHMITPLPGLWQEKPGSATLPFFGVVPAVLDEKGNELEGEAEGVLALKQPWPSTLRTVYNDHKRYEENYFGPFPGYYFSGDGCRRDADGYYWITGRVDDVINVSGHRIGTAEVESALVAHPSCAEAAVVGYDHPIKGQGIYAYVTLMEGVGHDGVGDDALKKQLVAGVRETIGAFAAPDVIHWAPGLPKTRSGKIMRRVLRKIASKEEEQLGDISTLADPSVVASLVNLRGK
ncbi:hypothetical protein CEUSTIGMA_g6186.t1 [Chlamydomonas eustigma]|uniref:Acetyl-coenzyme A synthetase n=1 Tax=Chlamydomonas eustigma TaxID=1157962 RepID=A0A250X755_9CHLO|nr:hypothetical protein CEUSTIGMA_g6186.t1 [Chlamydomonas eustigma]|eukprot:GAX78749.1 hypothetical protein CEUSTIGMA_g6186.t1 [Chlamydomonas eustigma]